MAISGAKTSLQLLRIVVGMKSSRDVFGGMLRIARRTSSSLMLANRRGYTYDGLLCARSTAGDALYRDLGDLVREESLEVITNCLILHRIFRNKLFI